MTGNAVRRTFNPQIEASVWVIHWGPSAFQRATHQIRWTGLRGVGKTPGAIVADPLPIALWPVHHQCEASCALPGLREASIFHRGVPMGEQNAEQLLQQIEKLRLELADAANSTRALLGLAGLEIAEEQ